MIKEMEGLSEELCPRVCDSVSERLQLCKDYEGEHSEQYFSKYFVTKSLKEVFSM